MSITLKRLKKEHDVLKKDIDILGADVEATTKNLESMATQERKKTNANMSSIYFQNELENKLLGCNKNLERQRHELDCYQNMHTRLKKDFI